MGDLVMSASKPIRIRNQLVEGWNRTARARGRRAAPSFPFKLITAMVACSRSVLAHFFYVPDGTDLPKRFVVDGVPAPPFLDGHAMCTSSTPILAGLFLLPPSTISVSFVCIYISNETKSWLVLQCCASIMYDGILLSVHMHTTYRVVTRR